MRYKIEKKRDENGILYYRGYKWFLFCWLPVTLSNSNKQAVIDEMGL
tara:strand:+ start:1815 stop:1955 length:141 start_codon:yes stop_codon:yes gene_type:complete